MDKKKKIVITGATGFVGQHLLEDFSANNYSITIITRDKNKSIRFLPTNCSVIEADLLNVISLKNALKDQDVLINLAAEVRNQEKFSETNITGTKNLIEAINYCGVKRVIHLSSCGIVGKSYSNSDLIVTEATICTPQNEYERTKYISENLFLETKLRNNFKLTILRPTDVYGEYHPFNALLRMTKYIQSGKYVAYQKNAIVNYVYVKDLTCLIWKIIESNEEHDIINVGQAETLETFFSKVAEQLNVKLKSIVIPSIFVKLSQVFGIKKTNTISNKIIFSDKKLKSFYQYPYGLNEGLRRTLAYYKKNHLII